MWPACSCCTDLTTICFLRLGQRVQKISKTRNQFIHTLRERVERTFGWEDKFKRLLLRFEYIQQRHYGMKLMAYTLINVRRFCSA